MKRNYFKRRGNLLTTALVVAIMLMSVFPTLTVSASTTRYTPNRTSNYQNYWKDVDEDDWDWDDEDRSGKSASYLKLGKTNYFSDVKGSRYGKYVNWCAKHGLLKKVAKRDKKFYPDKIMTKKELRQMLKNGYGSELSLKVGSSKAPVTQKYFCNLTAKAAEQLDYQLSWKDISKTQMDRGMVCYCFYQMVKTSHGAMYTIN